MTDVNTIQVVVFVLFLTNVLLYP